MDPVLALALVSLGLFVGVLVAAIVYLFAVRDRLLGEMDTAPFSTFGALDDQLEQEFAEQRAIVAQLNASLARHSEQLTAQTATDPGAEFAQLRGMLDTQTSTARALNDLVNAQTQTVAGFAARLDQQDDKLNRLGDRLDAMLGAPPSDAAAPPQIAALINEQADKLVRVSERLDEWASARARDQEQMSQHARILAELDRELAAQAQMVQQIDAKVGEHTSMLVTAASERHEQATLLQRALREIGQFGPLLAQLLKAPPRADQDRLTDIKGIGPVYAGKLYEAGIQTFRQLAALTPDELFALINEPAWRMSNINPAHWIEQASHLASQREKVEKIT